MATLISLSADIATILSLFATIFLLYQEIKKNTQTVRSLTDIVSINSKLNNKFDNNRIDQLTINNFESSQRDIAMLKKENI